MQIARMMEDAMRKEILRAVMIAATFVAGFAAQAEGISDGTVRIGVLTDMAGVFSDLGGVGAVAAAPMAIGGYVAKGKPLFKIQLESADHQNKPDIPTRI